MQRTLPIMTMCLFSKFGTGGKGEKIWNMCVLPINIVHQKFFMFAWFWIIFVGIVTGINLMFRVGQYVIPAFRTMITTQLWSVSSTDEEMNRRVRGFLDSCTSFSDWIVMSFYHANLTAVDFNNFLQDVVYNYDCRNNKKDKWEFLLKLNWLCWWNNLIFVTDWKQIKVPILYL